MATEIEGGDEPMNFAAWTLMALTAQQAIAPVKKDATLTFTAPLANEPTCTIPAGETTAICKPGARWTELIRVWRTGQGDLVCGMFETKIGDDWVVFEARLYCVRGRAQGGKR